MILLVLMGWYLYENKEIFSSLKNLDISDILMIAFLQAISVGIVALINKLVIDHIDQKISFSDSFLLQYANNFLNKIIAKGGSVYRGGYLKAQYAFPFSKFLASIGGVYIIGLMTNSVTGALLLITIYFTENVYNTFVLIIFLMVIAGILLLVMIEPKFNGNNWILRKVNQVLDGWNSIKSNRKLLFNIFILSVLGLLSSTTSVFIAYRGLDAEIKFINSLLYSSISPIANFVNVTPGGLGINEAVLVFSSEVIGISNDVLLLEALLPWVITLITSFALGGVSYLTLNSRLLKNTKELTLS